MTDPIRNKILLRHLQDISISSDPVSQEVAATLAYQHAVEVLKVGALGSGEETPATLGGISMSDIEARKPPALSPAAQRALAKALDATLVDILSFSNGSVNPDREEALAGLQENVRAEEAASAEVESRFQRVADLVEEVNTAQAELQQSLTEAFEIHAEKSFPRDQARYDLLCATADASLLKLSLIREQAKESLYGFSSSSNPSATMPRALENIARKARSKKHTLRQEERELDRRIKEYEDLKSVHGGALESLLSEWTKMKAESEEAKKDLRRLGWTGD